VVQEVREFLEEFKKANANEHEGQPENGEMTHHKWKAHPAGLQKVNWDVAVDNNNGRLGMRIIVRDHGGFVLTARSLTKMGNLEPVAVEAWAALHAARI
jgi:hypothetical protein